MASLIGNESNVKFSNINQTQIVTNSKIGAAPYIIDDNGNITYNAPVINAIDIDWNNVIANDITTPIKTTADLISVISTNKVNIRLNNEGIGRLRSTVLDLTNTVNSLIENQGSPEEFQTLKSQLLEALSDIETLETSVNSLQNSNTDVNNTLVRLSESITSINNSIPRYVSDLQDGYDVLRRSSFESIKDELKGETAFEIAKKIAQENGEQFNYSNEREWIASLKGEKGNTGASAYEIAKQTALILGKPFPYNNEAEWIESITNATEAKNYTDTRITEIINDLTLTAGNGITIENNVINATANTWINL